MCNNSCLANLNSIMARHIEWPLIFDQNKHTWIRLFIDLVHFKRNLKNNKNKMH